MLVFIKFGQCHLFSSDVGSQPEALNKKAIAIVNRVKDKLTG